MHLLEVAIDMDNKHEETKRTLSLRRRGRAGGSNEKGPRSMGAGQASEVREQAGKEVSAK